MTKEVATITGSLFTGILFFIFFFSERAHHKRPGNRRAHRAPRAVQRGSSPSRSRAQGLSLTKPYRKLVAIRSPYNLGMLEKCLHETDPETTDVVVMTATAAASRPAPTISRRSPRRTGSC